MVLSVWIQSKLLGADSNRSTVTGEGESGVVAAGLGDRQLRRERNAGLMKVSKSRPPAGSLFPHPFLKIMLTIKKKKRNSHTFQILIILRCKNVYKTQEREFEIMGA